MRIERVEKGRKDLPEKEDIDLTLISELIQKYSGKKGVTIPVLQETQAIYGYLPRAAFLKISEDLGIELSEMYGVATFYSQFRLAPAGKNIIKVCHGTACHVQNAKNLTESIEEALRISDGETTSDKLFTLESVACLGCCSLAPVMMIGEETFGKLTGKESVRIIKEIKLKDKNNY